MIEELFVTGGKIRLVSSSGRPALPSLLLCLSIFCFNPIYLNLVSTELPSCNWIYDDYDFFIETRVFFTEKLFCRAKAAKIVIVGDEP